MKKAIIKILITCIIVGGLGTGGYYGYKKYKASKTTVAASSYITMKTTKTNLQVSIQGTGAVYAGISKDINASSAGEIKDLNVNAGDRVAKDAILFTISNDQLQQAIDKAENTLAKQKLQLSNAKNTLSSAQQTLADIKANAGTSTSNKTMTVTEADAQVSKAKLDVSSAELAVKDAEKDLTAAKDQKNKATVKSPIEGLVVTKNKSTGDSVQAGNITTSSNSTSSILTIIDTNSFKVKVAVDELDIQKVKAGQKAEIKLGAIADKVYEGTVEEIALTGTTSNNVTTYDVVVAISNPENVKLGMNANVSILVESKENILVIPAEALVERNGGKFVMVADSTNTSNSSSQQANTEAGGNGGKQTQNNNQSTGNSQGMTANGRQGVNSGNRTANAGVATASGGKLVAIKTGIENQNYIEVTEGLTEGQQILVSLPQTSTSTNQSTRNTFSTGVGGFGGGAGVMGGNRQQAPTGNGGGNRQ